MTNKKSKEVFPEEGQMIKVKWIDIVSVSDWVKPLAIQRLGPMECTSVGFVVNSDDEVLRMCSTIGLTMDPDSPLLNDSMIIPRSVIRSIEVLETT